MQLLGTLDFRPLSMLLTYCCPPRVQAGWVWSLMRRRSHAPDLRKTSTRAFRARQEFVRMPGLAATLPACLPAQQGGGILCSGLHNFVAAHVASAHRASILQVGRLANLFPLYLFTPWVEDSLQVGQALTSTTAGVSCCRTALKS